MFVILKRTFSTHKSVTYFPSSLHFSSKGSKESWKSVFYFSHHSYLLEIFCDLGMCLVTFIKYVFKFHLHHVLVPSFLKNSLPMNMPFSYYNCFSFIYSPPTLYSGSWGHVALSSEFSGWEHIMIKHCTRSLSL